MTTTTTPNAHRDHHIAAVYRCTGCGARPIDVPGDGRKNPDWRRAAEGFERINPQMGETRRVRVAIHSACPDAIHGRDAFGLGVTLYRDTWTSGAW